MRDGNTESILEYNYLVGGPNHSWDKLFMPGGDNTTMGGRATPTQEMVESYELATTGGYPDWTPWHNTTTGTTDTPPYASIGTPFPCFRALQRVRMERPCSRTLCER